MSMSHAFNGLKIHHITFLSLRISTYQHSSLSSMQDVYHMNLVSLVALAPISLL